jgi:TolA-binding protein
MPVRPAARPADAGSRATSSPVSPALVRLALLALLAGAPALASAQPTPTATPGAPALGHADAAYEAARALYDAALFGRAADAFGAFRAAYPESPRRAEALFYEAESALNAGDDTRASALFARFRADYPAHALAGRAALALGTFYYGQGRYAEAEAALQDALLVPHADANAARLHYLLGQTALAQGRTAEAVASFDRASAFAETETAPRALYAASTVLVGEGDWAAAAERFERLARGYPDSPQNAEAGLGLAEAYARLGRFDEAAAEAARRLPSLTDDDRVRGHLLLGDALFRLGRGDEAREHFLAVPQEGPYGRRARFGLARLAYDEGDFTAAAEGFAAVREGTPEPADGAQDDALAHEATYFEGLALKQLGDLGEAERRLEAANARRPTGAYADAALLELGILRFERRDHEGAATAFRALIDTYGSSPYAGEAARMLGESYAALGDTERAREAYELAERLGTADPSLGTEVAFMEAYGLFREGRYSEAVPALLAVVEDDPRGPRAGEALFWAGEAAFQAREYGRAEDLLGRHLRDYPDHRQADAARYVLAWTHFKRRDYASAASAFERFLSAYTRSAESVPYYADALLRLGDAYYALRRFDEAIAVYNRVATATPDRQGFDYALFQIGQAHAAAGRTAEAFAAYDRVLGEFPASPIRPQARYARGFLLFNQGDYDGAIAEYQRVVQEHPDSPIAPKALYGIGDAHYNAGRLEEAVVAYRQVLSRYPDSPFVANAIEGLEYALEGLGRGDELDDILAAYEATNPDPAAQDRVRLRQAELLYENGDFEGAVTALEAFVQEARDPALIPPALLTLGNAYTALGRFEDAAGAFRRLADGHPDSPLRPEAVLRLGETLLEAGDAAGAAAALADYERRFPDDAERIGAALWAEARALRLLGDDAAADERVEHLLAVYPDTAAAEEARRTVEGADGG